MSTTKELGLGSTGLPSSSPTGAKTNRAATTPKIASKWSEQKTALGTTCLVTRRIQKRRRFAPLTFVIYSNEMISLNDQVLSLFVSGTFENKIVLVCLWVEIV